MCVNRKRPMKRSGPIIMDTLSAFLRAAAAVAPEEGLSVEDSAAHAEVVRWLELLASDDAEAASGEAAKTALKPKLKLPRKPR